MELVYMLTWLGYIDGKIWDPCYHIYPYIPYMDPSWVRIVFSLETNDPLRSCDPRRDWKSRKQRVFQNLREAIPGLNHTPWRIHGAAILMVTWIPSRLKPARTGILFSLDTATPQLGSMGSTWPLGHSTHKFMAQPRHKKGAVIETKGRVSAWFALGEFSSSNCDVLELSWNVYP